MGSKKENKVSKKILIGWPTQTISFAVASVLLGYATFFATDYMGINASTVGILFMVSKLFDGFTDIVAGYLIDRTHTKIGKARPYALASIGYWFFIIALFCAPEMNIYAGAVYLFVCYTMINSVFLTLTQCSESVYLANSLENSSQSVLVLSVGNLVSMVFTMAGSIIVPQLIKTIGTTREGWHIIALAIGIPFAIVGIIRFFVVKEIRVSGTVNKITVKEMLQLLGHNKYILLFSVIIVVANIGYYLVATAGTYYYQYIMGDIGLASIMSLTLIAVVAVIGITPALEKRFGLTNVVRICTIAGLIGYLLRLVNIHSVLILFIANLLSYLGFFPMFSFANKFVIDCMDYGEWKNKIRSEGTISCAQSVATKVGIALGTAVVGILMGLSGYDGLREVQASGTNVVIIALNSVIPALLCAIQLLLLKYYDLDKYLVQIREDLKKSGSADQLS